MRKELVLKWDIGMIERLVIKDFKSYEDSNIDFYPGLNVFLGEVGAGKTSVLEAISFAFFGRYAGNVTQSELIRRGAQKASITLVFTLKSGRYKVERTIHPQKPQKANLWVFDGKDWNLAVEGATAVSKSIEDLLEVDSSTFLAATYASQGEIKEMLQTQPGKRRDQLDRLLGIDMYEKIWRILGDSRNIVLNELTEAQAKTSGVEVIEEQIHNLRDRIKSNKEELTMLESFTEEIKERLQQAEYRFSVLEEQKLNLNNLQTKIEGTEKEIQKTSVNIKSLSQKIDKASEAEKIFQKYKKYMQQEENLEKEKKQFEMILQKKESIQKILKRDQDILQETIERLNKLEKQLEELTFLEKRLGELEKERKVLKKLKITQTNLRKKLDMLKEESAKASNQIDNEIKKADRVNKLSECPTCMQTVPEEHKKKIGRETNRTVSKLKTYHEHLENAKNQVQKELNKAERQIVIASEADKKYAETSAQIKMLEGCKEETKKVQIRIQKIQDGILKMKEEIANLKEAQFSLSKVIAELKETSVLANLAREAEKKILAKKDLKDVLLQEEKNLKDLSSRVEKMQSEKKRVEQEYDVPDHDRTKNMVKRLQEDKAKTQEGISRLNKSIEEDFQEIDKAQKELNKKSKAKGQVEKLKTENKVLEILRNGLREVVQPVVRKNNVLKVSEAFQGFYQELSNDNIDYAAIDEAGNVEVIRNGEPSPVNSLSGGETTCAALALRLAICSSLTKNQLLLLDEPTIHLDEVYRANLRDFLSSHGFEQLIVVTHDNTFDSLPAQIFRVEKRRGESIVTTQIVQRGT